MAFETKIKLIDSKVTQSGSTLHLSGNTIIASVGKLQYAVHPTLTGETQMTDKQYVDTCISKGVTGGTTYSLGSPAAVTVGGITPNYVLTGKSTNCILQDMLYPELCGTLTAPSMTSLVLAPSTSPLEVGSVISSLSITANFSQGSISPQYCSASPYRSGAAISYCFTGSINGIVACTANSAVTGVTNYAVIAGANTWGARTCYAGGQPAKSNKNVQFAAGLGAGIATLCENTITGIYPYYWGKVNAPGAPGQYRPASTAGLITGGTKVVADGGGTININFNSGDSDYIWFAVPSAIATKTAWYLTALNCGSIGGSPTVYPAVGSCLFPTPDTVSGVANGCWSGQSYKLYVSNYQSCVTSSMAIS